MPERACQFTSLSASLLSKVRDIEFADKGWGQGVSLDAHLLVIESNHEWSLRRSLAFFALDAHFYSRSMFARELIHEWAQGLPP